MWDIARSRATAGSRGIERAEPALEDVGELEGWGGHELEYVEGKVVENAPREPAHALRRQDVPHARGERVIRQSGRRGKRRAQRGKWLRRPHGAAESSSPKDAREVAVELRGFGVATTPARSRWTDPE